MTKKTVAFTFFLTLIFCSAAYVHANFMPDNEVINKNAPLFPHMLFTETVNSWRRAEASRPYWVNTPEETEIARQRAQHQVSILLNNDILSYYGHPNSRGMGVLGRHSIIDLDAQLTLTAASYEAVSGGRKIVKAFHLIYATIWPCANVGVLRHETLMRYINYGLENNILVFIDHQMGRHDPVDALRSMFPYLHYPNVHLALDPEWRTLKPNLEIGQVTADEINRAQQAMQDYLIANELPGERILVIHQFNHVMIRNRDNVKADFDRVRLVHNIAGIGTPEMKRETYALFARNTNMPIKGFKLWYDFGFSGHTDRPLMKPEEVYALEPRPLLIMYQ